MFGDIPDISLWKIDESIKADVCYSMNCVSLMSDRWREDKV
jgi:hypothetical protein